MVVHGGSDGISEMKTQWLMVAHMVLVNKRLKGVPLLWWLMAQRSHY